MVAAVSPLLVVVGQTASGKTDLAIKLAQKFNGEIICADSRTIYKKMDIGTAKPSKAAQSKIPHHLLDIVYPEQTFSASDMKILANKAMRDIISKGKLPILVGGTGLYIDSVVYDFNFGPVNKSLRAELSRLSDSQLIQRAQELSISESDINFQNRRHLVRAIERGPVEKKDKVIRENTLILGIELEKDELQTRIEKRIKSMLIEGLEEEVKSIANEYGFESPGMNTICYKEWKPYFEGEQSIEEVEQNLYKNTWQYARRQKTWFKRNQNIHWLTSVDEASVLTQQFLIQ